MAFSKTVAIFSLLPPAKEVWGKVMFLHLSVILFTGGGGAVCPISCWDTHPLEQTSPRQTLPGHTSPWTDTPWADTPPWTDPPIRILRDMDNNWAVRIPLECILVYKKSHSRNNCYLVDKIDYLISPLWKFTIINNNTSYLTDVVLYFALKYFSMKTDTIFCYHEWFRCP